MNHIGFAHLFHLLSCWLTHDHPRRGISESAAAAGRLLEDPDVSVQNAAAQATGSFGCFFLDVFWARIWIFF